MLCGLALIQLALSAGIRFLHELSRVDVENPVKDIDRICYACCHYNLRTLTREEQKKLYLDFGEKDFDRKHSRKTVPVYLPGAEAVIRPGHQHCGYMAEKTKACVEEIEAFMKRCRHA